VHITDMYVMYVINFELRNHHLSGCHDLRKDITALVSIRDTLTARKTIAVHPTTMRST
jgi:hypothetical protein